MKISGFLVLFVFSSPVMVMAQENDSLLKVNERLNRSYIQLYKENSDFSYTSPGGEIGAPSRYVINGKLTTNYMLLAADKLPVAFSIIPDFTVRVRNERSAGVRTPSFRLGGMFYVRLNDSEQDYRYVTLGFTHHSNGQDAEALNPDGTINTRTGNFSTNYLTAAFHFGNTVKHSDKYYTLNHSASLEWHKWFNYEKALEGDYGFTRLGYDFSLRKYRAEKESWRLNSEVNYAVNAMTDYQLMALKKRLNAEISFHYAFSFMNNVFLMAAIGYYGEDPYNIYYRDKYSYLRLGVSSGFARYKMTGK